MTAPLLVSTKLPSLSDVQAEIDALNQQLQSAQARTYGSFGGQPMNPNAGFPGQTPAASSGGYDPFLTHQGLVASLQRKIVDKQNLLDSLKNPTDTSGVPPAPEGPAILGPRIESPKVGLNDLKIMR